MKQQYDYLTQTLRLGGDGGNEVTLPPHVGTDSSCSSNALCPLGESRACQRDGYIKKKLQKRKKKKERFRFKCGSYRLTKKQKELLHTTRVPTGGTTHWAAMGQVAGMEEEALQGTPCPPPTQPQPGTGMAVRWQAWSVGKARGSWRSLCLSEDNTGSPLPKARKHELLLLHLSHTHSKHVHTRSIRQ